MQLNFNRFFTFACVSEVIGSEISPCKPIVHKDFELEARLKTFSRLEQELPGAIESGLSFNIHKNENVMTGSVIKESTLFRQVPEMGLIRK